MNYFLFLLVSFVSFGCATYTDEYISARSLCKETALQKFPINTVQELGNVSVPQRTPYSVTCTPPIAAGYAPICTQNYITTYITTVQVFNVDKNQESRDDYVERCTNSSCMAKFGNYDCKP